MAKLHISEPLKIDINRSHFDGSFYDPEEDGTVEDYGNGYIMPLPTCTKDRFVWRRNVDEDDDRSKADVVTAMVTVEAAIDGIVNHAKIFGFCKNEAEDLLHSHIDEAVFDNIEGSHITNPYSQFHYDKVIDKLGKENSISKPLTVLYAVDPFTLIVYPRTKHFLGDEVGTRIYIPRNCAVFIRYDLLYSDDHWNSDNSLGDEDDKLPGQPRKTNYRLRGHVIPQFMTRKENRNLAIDPRYISNDHFNGSHGHVVNVVIYVPIRNLKQLWQQIVFHQTRLVLEVHCHSRLGMVIGCC
jgi:hypothetical protein